ncbi:MAG: hypothetical protein WHV44_12325 [Anaerolineales bacterium]
MRKFLTLLLGAVLALTACAPTETPTPTPTPQVVTVYATPAAQPWLSDLFACAAPFGLVLRVVDAPAAAEIRLRLGEPAGLAEAVYQVGVEQVLVVAHPSSPLQPLSTEETRALFAGAGLPSGEVWVYAEGEDIQQVFSAEVMGGQLVSSEARMVGSPQQMTDALTSTPGAVGILPQRGPLGSLRIVHAIPNVPVLALLSAPPVGAVQGALACMQQKTAP